MSVARTLAVAVLSLLLVGSLVGASAAVGANRTAFDADYVVETFEQEDVHGSLAAELRANAAQDAEGVTGTDSMPAGITIALDGPQAINESITDEVVRQQLERQIRGLYAYLHGDRAELDLVTNFTAIKGSLEGRIIDATTIDTATLVGTSSDDIGADRVARLREGPASYEEAQLTLPESEEERIRNDLETSVREEFGDQPDPLTESVLSLYMTVFDGLTGELTYETYTDQVAADEQRVKTELAAAAVAELPDEEPVFAEEDDPEAQFAPFRTAVSWATTLSWLLPLLGVVLVGLVYGVSRSVDQTAAVTAGALFWAGLLWVVFGLFLRGPLLAAVTPDGDPGNPLATGLLAVLEGTLETIGTQSVLLAVAGVVLYALVAADRRGKLDDLRARAGYAPRHEPSGGGDADE